MFAYCLNNPVMYVNPRGCEGQHDEFIKAICGMLMFAVLRQIGYPFAGRIAELYKASDNDGLLLFELTKSACDAIEFIANGYNTGFTIEGLKSAGKTVYNIAKTVGPVIEQSSMEVINNYLVFYQRPYY